MDSPAPQRKDIVPRDKVDRQKLYEAVWAAPLTSIASRYGLTANGLAKLCDRQDVPRPSRGYWRLTESERESVRPPLPEASPARGQNAHHNRNRRVRMPIRERRIQLLDIAGRIVLSEGADAVSMNRLARDAGISEAQAHNCFARRIDVLIELARRETAAFEKSRREIVIRGRDRQSRMVLSTANYLTLADKRGALMQALLLETDVRETLRSEHEASSQLNTAPIVQSMEGSSGPSRGEEVAHNWLVTALCLRTGRLIGNGSLSLESAMRLCLPMVMGCVRTRP